MVKINRDVMVMSTRHSKCFFSIYIFRHLIMNTDFKKNYRKYGQHHRWLYKLYHKNYDTASHPTNFCEMLIGGRKLLTVICFSKSLISGQMLKTILQILKGYFTKWCQINPIWDKMYVTLMGTTKENYALFLHK